ncbi:MAG: ATP-binding cassette domain-containing protein [Methylobacter sp.]
MTKSLLERATNRLFSCFQPKASGRVPAGYLQTQTTECGLGAMAMILGHFGRFVTLEELRQVSGVSRDCVNAVDLVRIANHYGLAPRVLRREPEGLADLGFPLVVYLNFIHFVVVEAITEEEVWLNDPACGRHRMPREQFHESFTGIALIFALTPEFQPGGKRPSTLASVRSYLAGSGMGWLVIALLAGLMLTAPLVLFARLFGAVLDRLPIASAPDVDFLLPVFLGLAGAVALRAGLKALQTETLARLESRLCRERLPALVNHLLGLPYAFFVYRIPAVLHGRIYGQELIANLLCGSILPAVFNLPGLLLPLAAFFYYDSAVGCLVVTLTLIYLALLALIFQGKTGDVRLRREQDDTAWMKLAHALRNFESFKTGGGGQEFFSGSMGGSAVALRLRQEFGWFFSLSELATDSFAAILVLAVLGSASSGLAAGEFGMGGLFAMLCLVGAMLDPLRDLARLHGKVDTIRQLLPPIEDLREQVSSCGDLYDKVTNCSICPPLPEGEGWGEGVLKSTIRDRFHYNTMRQQSPDSEAANILTATDISFGFTRVKPPLLQGISLAVAPGEQLGITGPSGGGKSTLVELLLGLHQPWTGEVLFDGKPLASPHPAPLPGGEGDFFTMGRGIGWVNKHPFFFAGTVRENLCLWDEGVSEADIQAAIRDTCLEETIAACQEGLDTVLSPRAENFSGGQRQRLEIARVLLRKPRILVLDEATDGLDHALEQRLRANLKRLGMTLIVVSHRASTLAACDRVLRLAGGRVVEDNFVAAQAVPQVSLDFAADEDPVLPPRPPGDRRAALIQAFRWVAQAIGEPGVMLPTEPLPVEGQTADEQGIYALARFNNIPVRHVRFVVAQWWQRDHGPLIAFTRDGRQPVALLPDGAEGYIIANPADGKRERLTQITAQSLERRAYMLYARFAPKRLRPWTFFCHAFRQAGPDLGTALVASFAVATLAVATPFAAYVLYAEVLPFADASLARQWQGGLALLGLALMTGECIRLLALHRLEGRLEVSASSALYQHVLRVQMLFFRDHSPEEIARSLNCVPRVLALLRNGTLRRLLGGLAGIAGLAVIAWFSGQLAAAALALLMPLVLLPVLLTRMEISWAHALFVQRLDGNQFLFELLKGIPRLRQMGRDRAALDRWAQDYAAEQATAGRIRRSEARVQYVVDAYPWLAMAGFAGVIAVQPGRFDSPADAAAMLLAFQSAVFAIRGFSLAVSDTARVLPLLDRLTPLAEASLEPVGTVPDQGGADETIELRKLTFTYPGTHTPTLTDVSLRIEPGRFIALAGPSGSGKSTLLRLLLGFYAADSGGIFRNGEPHVDSNISAWRGRVGAVLQDDQLEIAMSVRGHILGNGPYTMAEIRAAARLAMLEPDINAMPMGILSIVDSDRVSTGQKQRLLIAHRLLRRPKLLILDEATNALPEDIQAELLANLRELGLACLLVSHRASTIAAADYVYLMDAGRIAWQGTPADFVGAGLAPVMREEEDESDL